jgi:D-galactarolactone cycloisomerase
MKIARVEAIPLSIPARYGADAWTLGTGGWQALDFCLVRVDTDAGLTGWGEAFSYSCRRPVAAAIKDMIAPLAVGHDAADIAGLHATIQKRLHIFGRFGIAAFALSGLDIALWDIAGKAAGKPLHALLGGARRERLGCYASLLRYADGALAASYCERALGEGFGAIKLHEVSEPVIAAARSAVPRDKPLLLDVNCEWSVGAAIEVGRRLAPLGLEWFEEPVFPPEDGAGLRAVGEACDIPIAAGENCCFATQFAALFDARAVQVAQPSVTKVGGITEFRRRTRPTSAPARSRRCTCFLRSRRTSASNTSICGAKPHCSAPRLRPKTANCRCRGAPASAPNLTPTSCAGTARIDASDRAGSSGGTDDSPTQSHP